MYFHVYLNRKQNSYKRRLILVKKNYKLIWPLLLLVACNPYRSYKDGLREPEKVTKLKLSNGNFVSTPDRIEEIENLEKL